MADVRITDASASTAASAAVSDAGNSATGAGAASTGTSTSSTGTDTPSPSAGVPSTGTGTASDSKQFVVMSWNIKDLTGEKLKNLINYRYFMDKKALGKQDKDYFEYQGPQITLLNFIAQVVKKHDVDVLSILEVYSRSDFSEQYDNFNQKRITNSTWKKVYERMTDEERQSFDEKKDSASMFYHRPGIKAIQQICAAINSACPDKHFDYIYSKKNASTKDVKAQQRVDDRYAIIFNTNKFHDPEPLHKAKRDSFKKMTVLREQDDEDGWFADRFPGFGKLKFRNWKRYLQIFPWHAPNPAEMAKFLNRRENNWNPIEGLADSLKHYQAAKVWDENEPFLIAGDFNTNKQYLLKKKQDNFTGVFEPLTKDLLLNRVFNTPTTLQQMKLSKRKQPSEKEKNPAKKREKRDNIRLIDIEKGVLTTDSYYDEMFYHPSKLTLIETEVIDTFHIAEELLAEDAKGDADKEEVLKMVEDRKRYYQNKLLENCFARISDHCPIYARFELNGPVEAEDDSGHTRKRPRGHDSPTDDPASDPDDPADPTDPPADPGDEPSPKRPRNK